MKKLKKNSTITIIGRRWFERTNGNTYHSVNVSVNGEYVGGEDFDYGYGSMYEQCASVILRKQYKLPIDTKPGVPHPPLWRLRDHGINVVSTVSDVARKKDL